MQSSRRRTESTTDSEGAGAPGQDPLRGPPGGPRESPCDDGHPSVGEPTQRRCRVSETDDPDTRGGMDDKKHQGEAQHRTRTLRRLLSTADPCSEGQSVRQQEAIRGSADRFFSEEQEPAELDDTDNITALRLLKEV